MSTSSVHHQPSLSNKLALLSKTPAINKNIKRTQLNKTVGPKPKQFEIYTDLNHSSPPSNKPNPVPTQPFKPSISATPANSDKNKAKNSVPSTRQKASKPLEDKTNRIRRRNNLSDLNARLDPSEQEANLSPSLKGSDKPIQPSQDVAQPTPYNPSRKSLKFRNQVSPPNTKLKLLYRTPTTAKRATRPPQPTFSSDCDDNDGLLDASPVKSACSADTFQIDLSLQHIPDVEYGPPSASFESVESPLEENVVDFSKFFDSLHASRNQLISSFGDDLDSSAADPDKIHQIMEEDGRKDRWLSEPICPMASYQGDQLLDDLHLPSLSTRPSAIRTTASRKPTSATHPLRATASRSTLVSPGSRDPARPAASLCTRSRLAQALMHAPTKRTFTLPAKLASTTCPPVAQAPLLTMAARYQDLLATLVRQDQLLVEEDLKQFLSSDGPLLDCSAWDPQLDQFLLDL